MPKLFKEYIAELATSTPSADDYMIHLDNADSQVKKNTISSFPITVWNAQWLVTSARNNTGSTLYKWTIVYVNGGIAWNPTVAKAQANSESTSSWTFWVVYADIPNNTVWTILVAGKIDTLDTRTSATNPFTSVTLADGDKLYLDPTTAWYVTNVKPVAPNHMVYLGTVTNASPTSGTIEYKIVNGYELDEIHDVLIASKADWDVLTYESASTLWKNKTQDNAWLVTKTTAQTISGIKTFLAGTLWLRNVANTFTSFFTNTNTASRTYTLPDATTTLVWTDTTQTLTNKTLIATTNVISENTTTASSATPTPTWWSLRNYFTITALATAPTFSAPSGTPVDWNMLIIRIKDNGTARALSWNAIYRSGDTTLPTTTVISKTLYLMFIYNSADSKWDLISKEDNH